MTGYVMWQKFAIRNSQFAIRNSQFAIRNSQFAIRNSQFAIRNNSAFTLIELSIAIVIIGLVVGGVMVGRDLIKSSEIRAQIRQLEQFTTAINTFKLKYNYLPGDLPLKEATAFGFPIVILNDVSDSYNYSNNRDGIYTSNGNGFIEDRAFSGVNELVLGGYCNYETGEPVYFWQDLRVANLINPRLYTLPEYWNGVHAGVVMPQPIAEFGQNNFVIIDEINRKNIFLIQGTNPVNFIHSGYNSPSVMAFSPLEAFTLDSKIDDGKPLTGKVVNYHVTYGAIANTSPENGYCVTGAGDYGNINSSYNTTVPEYTNTKSCRLSIFW